MAPLACRRRDGPLYGHCLASRGAPSAPGEGFPPRALILTVLGAYVRQFDSWISIAALIELMAALRVSEQGVRSAVSRLKRRGILVPERRNGAAGYSLSADGIRMLNEGDARIVRRRPRASADDRWAIVVFSVPDS
jgi:phenylacetic acid degradation operon negative regulatory protein